MVTCQVGENSPRESQAANALLCDGVTGTFHEYIVATRLHHFVEQIVQFYGVWSGVVGWYGAFFYVVAYRGQQPAFVSQFSEHII